MKNSENKVSSFRNKSKSQRVLETNNVKNLNLDFMIKL